MSSTTYWSPIRLINQNQFFIFGVYWWSQKWRCRDCRKITQADDNEKQPNFRLSHHDPKVDFAKFPQQQTLESRRSQWRMDFSSTRALLVGAGGIGCELLKTLCLHNFKHIFIVPLPHLPHPSLRVVDGRLIWIRLTCRIWIDSFCFDIIISRNQRLWYVFLSRKNLGGWLSG